MLNYCTYFPAKLTTLTVNISGHVPTLNTITTHFYRAACNADAV